MYNARLESFHQLPKDKRPPRYMWDRPYELSQYLEHVWDKDEDTTKDNFSINFEDAE